MSRPYDALAEHYDQLLASHRQRILELVTAAIDQHCPRARRVLDVGCGTGALAEQLVRRRLEVVALDPSPAMLRVARRRLRPWSSQVTLSRGALGDSPLPPVDAVVATFEVVNHLRSIAELDRFLRRARRALAGGGVLWFDASTVAWFRTMWRSGPRELAAGTTRSRWSPTYDGRRRRGLLRVELWPQDARRPLTDRIEMRPFEIATVRAALARTGLRLVATEPLQGVRLGPRTGRVAYVARA